MPEIIVRLGDQEVQRYTMDRDLIIVGRSNKSDIVIENLSVSRRHAEIQRKDGEYYLTDLGSANGSVVNGVRVSRTQIVHNDVIRLGKHDLYFLVPETLDRVPAEAPPADFEQTIIISTAPGQGYLTVRPGKQAGTVHALTNTATQIGRAPDNDIRVLDWFVDPHQDVIEQEGTTFKIRNLAENHPITVNGNPVEDNELKEGDVIQMGTTQVIFTSQLQNAEAIKDQRVPEKMTPLPMEVAPGDEEPIIAPYEEPSPESEAAGEQLDALSIQSFPEPEAEETSGTEEPVHRDPDIILGSGHEAEDVAAAAMEDDSLGELLESEPRDYRGVMTAPTHPGDQEMGELLDADILEAERRREEPEEPDDQDELETVTEVPWDMEAEGGQAQEEVVSEAAAEEAPPEEPSEIEEPPTEKEEIEPEAAAEPEEAVEEEPAEQEAEEAVVEEPASEEAPSGDMPELSKSDAKMVAFWEKALNNPSPAVQKQATEQLKRLTGRDYV